VPIALEEQLALHVEQPHKRVNSFVQPNRVSPCEKIAQKNQLVSLAGKRTTRSTRHYIWTGSKVALLGSVGCQAGAGVVGDVSFLQTKSL
jgi:hypothetical protein